ncbi:MULTISPECIES: UDP-glucose/GDP-mannose dehydrogenase family protein [Arthrobacter]|uniref:UDP-glucose 6-dehydrogenase n=2 Tax=Arthrobacter TaxID=1663 RepID=A0ABU9KQ83_9MICC|nr:UDP-glucose/GDP-mannose dehydrogenase family protein [Arthrobacter sp. YJM1]MDP5227668.1 UDP-glucose/GDP-mannose dehydrogenase family protein [Arthrobacter sp. YJM1]
MRISVIGCGYLGAVHAATLASMGHDVVGIDTDESKVRLLSRGVAPFYEPGLEELLAHTTAQGTLRFSRDFSETSGADVHFLCVGTPQSKTGDGADLGYLLAATQELRRHARAGSLVVGKSTVPVGTVDVLGDLLAERGDLLLAWNPEFLRQGTAVKDSLVPDRLVYGAEGPQEKRAVEMLDAVYAPLLGAGVPRIVCNFATAELIKSAANAYLATKLSFINAMGELCDAAGADVVALSEAMGLDPRIGARYLHAGLGFGGGCLPKDIRSLRTQAGSLGVTALEDWMGSVDTINREQRARSVSLAADLLGGSVAGRQVTVLGAAFKPDTDDIRDSPAMDVAMRLVEAGAHVTVTDPKAINNAWLRFPQMRFETKPLAALDGAELVVLATEWDEFCRLDPAVAGKLVRRRLLLDTRNALDADSWAAEGWTVAGLGVPGRRPRARAAAGQPTSV